MAYNVIQKMRERHEKGECVICGKVLANSEFVLLPFDNKKVMVCRHHHGVVNGVQKRDTQNT